MSKAMPKLPPSKPKGAPVDDKSATIAPDQNHQQPQKALSRRQVIQESRTLAEQRKFGLAPLAVDTVTGQEISPHLPEAVAKVPWYYGQTGDTLLHQRNPNKRSMTTVDDRIDKIVEMKPPASTAMAPTRFRPGACTNCGALGHTAKQCTERPKRYGAQVTGIVTGKDAVFVSANRDALGYEAKRDSCAGIDIHEEVQKRFAKRDRAEDDDNDPSKLQQPGLPMSWDESSAPKGATRTSGGALPKYLINLDPGSAYYDPSTRTMRANPLEGAAPGTKVNSSFRGDNEKNTSGEHYKDYVERMAFQFKNAKEGADLMMLPTENEAAFQKWKEEQAREAAKKAPDAIAKMLEEKYGPTVDSAKAKEEERIVGPQPPRDTPEKAADQPSEFKT